jgi:hypothetical protein
LLVRWSIKREAASREAGFPVEPAFGRDLGLAANLDGLLARDAPLAFGFALLTRLVLLSVIIRSFT